MSTYISIRHTAVVGESAVRRSDVASLGGKLTIFVNLRAYGGEKIAHNGSVDAYTERLELHLTRQTLATSGKPQLGLGMEETEKGHGKQNLFIRKRWCVGQRSTWYRREDIDGYRVWFHVAKGQSQFDPLPARFTHADDASAAKFKPNLPSPTQGLELLLQGMRGAHLAEIGGCSLEVAMVSAHSNLPQLLQLLTSQ